MRKNTYKKKYRKSFVGTNIFHKFADNENCFLIYYYT